MVKESRSSVARALPAEPLYPRMTAPPRRRRARPDARRFRRSLLAMGAAAAVVVLHLFSCAVLAQSSYRAAKLRRELQRLQVEHQLLQAELADLRRIDRVVFLARQQGMVPRERLRYVKLLPPPAGPAFQQASARP